MVSPLISTIWTLPRHMRAAVQSRFYLSSDSIDVTSPWTRQRSVYGPTSQYWLAEITPPDAPGVKRVQEFRDRGDTKHVNWREWQGFITRLRGTSGLIRLVDYYRMQPAYNERVALTRSNFSDGSTFSDGSQWVEGALPPFVTLDEAASADADSVVVRGLPADTEEVLTPGDVMEGRPNGIPTAFGNLYEIVHCARTNSAGKARVYLQPGLRQAFAAGDMFVLKEPTCVMRLADKDQGIVTRSVGNIGRLGLSLVEELMSDA